VGRYRQDNSSLESGEIPEIHEESRDYADEEHEDHQKRIDVDHHVDRGKDTPRFFNKEKRTHCKGQAANRPNPNPQSLPEDLHYGQNCRFSRIAGISEPLTQNTSLMSSEAKIGDLRYSRTENFTSAQP
jgi:hypothetical protein